MNEQQVYNQQLQWFKEAEKAKGNNGPPPIEGGYQGAGEFGNEDEYWKHLYNTKIMADKNPTLAQNSGQWIDSMNERAGALNQAGPADYFNQRMQAIEGMKAYQGYSQDARQRALQSRGDFYGNLDMLAGRARGEGLVSDSVIQQQQDQMNSRARSMLASQRGGNNPNAFRQAQMGMAGQGQQMAAQAAQMKAAEQAQAQQAYIGALQQGRQGDLQQLQQEFAGEQALNNFTLQALGLSNNTLGYGLQDKAATMQNIYQNKALSEQGREFDDKLQLERDKNKDSNIMNGIFGSISSLLAGAGTVAGMVGGGGGGSTAPSAGAAAGGSAAASAGYGG